MSEELEGTESPVRGDSPATPDSSELPAAPPPQPPARMSKSAKVALGAIVAVVVVAGLYSLNRWIASSTVRPVKAASNYPMAPDFSVADIGGQRVSLADYRGRVVLLDFWATWCGPCRIEIPEFIQMQSRYRDQGFAIIGLATQDQLSSVQQFYKQFGMDYTVAMSNDRIEASYGGILGLPTTFVIGRDGRIYSKHTGATSAAVFEQEVKQLLATPVSSDSPDFRPVGRAEDVDLGTPGESNPEVPGVDISKLTPTQLAAFKKQLQGKNCTCGGCKFNLLDCRKEDTTCSVSRKIAKDELKAFQKSEAPSSSTETGGSKT